MSISLIMISFSSRTKWFTPLVASPTSPPPLSSTRYSGRAGLQMNTGDRLSPENSSWGPPRTNALHLIPFGVFVCLCGRKIQVTNTAFDLNRKSCDNLSLHINIATYLAQFFLVLVSKFVLVKGPVTQAAPPRKASGQRRVLGLEYLRILDILALGLRSAQAYQTLAHCCAIFLCYLGLQLVGQLTNQTWSRGHSRAGRMREGGQWRGWPHIRTSL